MTSNKLILGTVQFGLSYGINNESGRPSKMEVFDILDKAYDAGVRQLDSAAAYGDAETIIGEFIQQSGRQFLINTKFHAHGEIPITEQLGYALDRLNVGHIHTYFYHRFEDMHKAPETLDALNALKGEKKIKKIGVSVYTNDEFETCINNAVIDVVQLPYNLLDNYSRRGGLIQRAKKYGKDLQVRSVFLQGLFFKKAESLPHILQPLKKYLLYIQQLAAEYQISMFDLALGYVLSKKELNGVIIGVDSRDQLLKNLKAQQTKLPESLIQQIDAIQVEEESLLYPYNWK